MPDSNQGAYLLTTMIDRHLARNRMRWAEREMHTRQLAT